MTSTFYFLVFLVSHAAIVQIGGQEFCAPSSVEDITLYDDHTLSWNPSSTEICAVDHYLVSIITQSNWEERVFLTEQTHMDVGYLPQCETVTIYITPISSDNVEGERTFHLTKTSAPPDVNLDLIYIRLYEYSDTVVALEWDVAEDWLRCAKSYRVVTYSEDDDVVLTTYVPYPYAMIRDIIPCSSYVFTVTALHSLEEEGQVSVVRYTSPAVKITPALERLTVGSTTADLTWTFPVPTVNRCPITALVVDGSPSFNSSYPITGQNQLTKPPMDVHLTGLQPDTMYILRVSASNSAGFSPFIVGLQTLEE